MQTVILIGDSIRMGYQEVVRRALAGVAQVWTPAENGGNSQNVLDHLEAWAVVHEPRVVHLNCGLHDVRWLVGATGVTIPLPQYEANMRLLLKRLQEETQATTIWATSTPIDEALHRQHWETPRSEADVEAYNDVSVRVAEEFGVPVNDLFAALSQAGKENYLTDGAHLTDEGYALLGEAVAEFIRPYLAPA